MKQSQLLFWLSWLVVLLALVYAGLGLFWQRGSAPFDFTTVHGQTVQIYGQGIYGHDPVLNAAGNRGTDAGTLLIALPLLVISIFLYRRGSLTGGLLLASILSYFLYNGATMAFGVAYNSLVFVYAAAFSASLFAFILACTAIDPTCVAEHVSPAMPRRGIAAFLIFAGIATAGIWLSDMLPAMQKGSVPATLASYTTIFTYAFDLAVITPATVLTGVLLLRRVPLGYLLAPILLILCTLVGVVVIAQTIFQLGAGVTFSPGQFVGLIGSWVVMGAIAIALTFSFFRHLNESGTSPVSPAHLSWEAQSS